MQQETGSMREWAAEENRGVRDFLGEAFLNSSGRLHPGPYKFHHEWIFPPDGMNDACDFQVLTSMQQETGSMSEWAAEENRGVRDFLGEAFLNSSGRLHPGPYKFSMDSLTRWDSGRAGSRVNQVEKNFCPWRDSIEHPTIPNEIVS
ncbi:hypothetical protein QAD02_008404 [Eretmocerus hayati]|uniref:Uncharacterized protein n=1 Tax=Eretmocerus hayati TaxID=131215 RepID=A0ACC2N6N9_9HYME|nr:hypothetical protein QAD02_008404 [Eretmocerus hayati]